MADSNLGLKKEKKKPTLVFLHKAVMCQLVACINFANCFFEKCQVLKSFCQNSISYKVTLECQSLMWRRFMVYLYQLLVEAYLGEAEKQINLELN